MAVRKSKKRQPNGRPWWIADYTDQHGKRHQPRYTTERAANSKYAEAMEEVHKGTHTPASVSMTVAEAAQLWLRACEQNNYRPGSLYAYRSVVDTHIIGGIGAERLARVKLGQLTKK